MAGDRFEFVDSFDPDADTPDADGLDRQKSDYEKLKSLRYLADTGHREKLVAWIRWLIPIYLLLMFAALGFGSFLSIPPSVLVALLCTTTANVLGLAAIVLRGLFR